MLIALTYPSNPIVAVIVAVLIVVATRPIIRRVAILEGHAWLVRVMTISLILHLVAAPAQIFVVDHFYHGIADWLRYDNQGAGLAGSFRHFDFSLANGNLRGIVNDGSVSIAAGIVFTFVGTNPLAGFLVFSWLAFLGTMFFFRAFALDLRRCRPPAVRLPAVLPPVDDLLDGGRQQGGHHDALPRRPRLRCRQDPGPSSRRFHPGHRGGGHRHPHPTERAAHGGGRVHGRHDPGFRRIRGVQERADTGS